MTAVLLC